MQTADVSRFLITTPLKGTWPDKGPVLFLGEWCKLYPEKKTWEALDSAVVPYVWDDRKKFESDYHYLQGLYERLLPSFAAALDALHGTHHDQRYWRIVVGPWLNIFIQIVYERWIQIKKAEKEFRISGVYVTSTAQEEFVPYDTYMFVDFFISSEWNYFVYSYIIRNYTGIRWKEKHSAAPVKSIPAPDKKGWIATVVERLMSLVDRRRNILITGASLPRSLYLALLLKKGILVKSLPASALRHCMPDEGMRTKISDARFAATSHFEECIWKLISRQAPISLIEEFHFHTKQAAALPLPLKPTSICTSNVYYHEDFRFWLAEKLSVNSKAKLFILQHGGSYGVARWFTNEEHEIKIADLFLSWGWTRNDPKVVPFGMLKTNPFQPRNQFDQPDVLLITRSLPLYSYKLASEHISSQLIHYYNDQITFISLLPPYIQSAIVLRQYYVEYGWHERARIEEFFPRIRIADKNQQVNTLAQRSRIVISTYNSTSFLETMSVNIPTLMFWDPAYNELNEDAVPFFEDLRRVGVFHESPASAAAHLGKVWNDIGGWWESSEVQNTVAKMVGRYSAKVEAPIFGLACTLVK